MTPDTKEPRHPYERIYLVADDTELSWCEDRITPDDTEYVRADLFNRLTRELAEADKLFATTYNELNDAKAELAARDAVIEKAKAIRHLIVGSRGRFCSTECLGTCPECRAIAEFESALAAGGKR